ncbi:MAG: zinc-binding dehydrogenase [Candidatus Parabeggiatoa sp.]|nr:zinc-binding dehydrogenase [Candidatus Parabeggiatoa sp.]
MKSKNIVVYADSKPIKNIEHPGTHQIYQNPRVFLETRTLGDLAPNEIRVQMIYAGVCGTDIHLLETNPDTGYTKCSAPAFIPETGRVLGHEGVGKVLAIGQNIRHLGIGDYVALESIIVCHYCYPCRKGNFNQCINAKLLGMEKDGIFGSIVDIPGMLAYNISDYLQDEQDLQAFACIEPAGVAYLACENAQIKPGSRILIFGAGPIGLLTALMSKEIFGACEVHLVEPVNFRRQFAQKWADQVYDVNEFLANRAEKFDVVIEASGNLNNINATFRQLNPNGHVILLARSGEPLLVTAVDQMITNQISITGSRGHLGGIFQILFELYKSGKLPLQRLVTNIVPSLEELNTLLRENRPKIIEENCKVLVQVCQDY